jgi:hypothetical protein
MLLLLGTTLGGLISASRRLPIHLMAALIDRQAGLGAGLRTALELQEREHDYASALQSSARVALAGLRPAHVLPLQKPPQSLNALLVLAIAVALIYAPPLVTKPQETRLDKVAHLKQTQVKSLQKAATDLRSQSDHEPVLRQIARETQNLTDELAKKRLDLQTAFDQLGRLEERLHGFQAEDAAKERVREALKNPSILKELQKTLRTDSHPLSDDLRNQAKELSEHAKGDSDLKQAIDQLEKAGSSLARRDAADNLMRALNKVKESESKLNPKTSKSLDALKDAIQETQTALAENASGAEKPETPGGSPTPDLGELAKAEVTDPKSKAETAEKGAEAANQEKTEGGVIQSEGPKSTASEKKPQSGSNPDSEGAVPEPKGSSAEAENSNTKGAENTEKAGPKASLKAPFEESGKAEKAAPDNSPESEVTPQDGPEESGAVDQKPDAQDGGEPEAGDDRAAKSPEKTEKLKSEDADGGLLGDLAVSMAEKFMEMGIEPPTDMLEGTDLMDSPMVQEWAKSMVEKLIDSGFKVPDDFKAPKLPESMKDKDQSPEMKAWQKKIAEKLLKSGFKPPKSLSLPENMPETGQKQAKAEVWQKDFAKKLLDSGFEPPADMLKQAQTNAAKESVKNGTQGTGPATAGQGGQDTKGFTGSNMGQNPAVASGSKARKPGTKSPMPGVKGSGTGSAKAGQGSGSGKALAGAGEGIYSPKLLSKKGPNGQKAWVIAGPGQGASSSGNGSTVYIPGSAKGRPSPAAKVEPTYDAYQGGPGGRRGRKIPSGYKAHIKRYFEHWKESEKKK